jgi:hypothetical protein
MEVKLSSLRENEIKTHIKLIFPLREKRLEMMILLDEMMINSNCK